MSRKNRVSKIIALHPGSVAYIVVFWFSLGRDGTTQKTIPLYHPTLNEMDGREREKKMYVRFFLSRLRIIYAARHGEGK